jgi:hypothetical protein
VTAHTRTLRGHGDVSITVRGRTLVLVPAGARRELISLTDPLEGFLAVAARASIAGVHRDSLVRTTVRVYGAVADGPAARVAGVVESQRQLLRAPSRTPRTLRLPWTGSSLTDPSEPYRLEVWLGLERTKFNAPVSARIDSVHVELGPLSGDTVCAGCRKLRGEISERAAVAAFMVENGTPAKLNEFPDVVAVAGRNEPRCSGTLVAPRIVVSVAHCLGADRVYFGNRYVKNGGGTVVAVAQSKVAPRTSGQVDVPLVLWLAKSPYDGSVAPVRRLAKSSIVDNAAFGLIAGFGASGSQAYGTKRHGQVNVLSRDCKGSVGGSPEAEFYRCRGGSELVASGTQTNTCGGDSGGPLIVAYRGTLYLAGITSRPWKGQPGCKGGSIFVRVDSPREGGGGWLEQVIGGTNQLREE